MSIPGGLGPGDNVGFIYVTALTDTSGMKDQLEKDSKAAARSAGKESGKEFARAQEDAINKETNEKLYARSLKKLTKKFALEYRKGWEKELKGGADPTLIFEFTDKHSKQIKKLANTYGVEFKDAFADVGAGIPDAITKTLDDIERSIAKHEIDVDLAFKLNTKFDEKQKSEQTRALRSEIADLKRGLEQDLKKSDRELIRRGEEIVKHEMDVDLAYRLNVRFDDQAIAKETAERKKEIKELQRELQKTANEDLRNTKRGNVFLKENARLLDRVNDKLQEVSANSSKYSKKYKQSLDAMRKAVESLPQIGKEQRVEAPDLTRILHDFEEGGEDAAEAFLQGFGEKVDRTDTGGFFSRLRRRKIEVPVELDVDYDLIEKQLSGALSRSFQKAGKGRGNFFDRLTAGLRRAGTGGAFDTVTNVLGSLVRLAPLAGKAVAGVFKGIGFLAKGAGDALDWLGDRVLKLGDRFAGLASLLGGMGGALGKFGSAISAASGPIGMAVQAGAAVGILGLIISAIQLLSPLIFNLAGGFTLLAGALFNTIAAAALFLPILTALGIGAGVAFVAAKDAGPAFLAMAKAVSSGDAKAMEEYSEALEKLGPNAKAAVRAAEPLVRVFGGLQNTLEKRFFEGMAENIKGLKPLFEGLKAPIANIAGAVGNVIDKFLALGQNQKFMESLTQIFIVATPIIENFGTIFASIFGGIVNVMGLVSGLATQLSGKIAGVAESFQKFTESEESRQKILDFFTGAYNVAKQVFDIIGTLGAIMVQVFTETQGPLAGSGGFLQAINDRLDDWLLWVRSNGPTIRGWFDDAVAFIKAVWEEVEKVIQKFAEWNTKENQEKLREWVEILGNIVRGFMDVVGAIGNVVGAIPGLSLVAGVLERIGRATGIAAEKKSVIGPFVPNLDQRLPGPRGGKVRLAAGGIVMSPTHALIGEAGPEAVIPLTRPLAQVSPEVRELAKLLRTRPDVESKTVNLTQNITVPQTDPKAAAASMLNHAVALARI